MEIDLEKFKKVKEEAEECYKSIGNVYCPYFQDKIVFNAKGIEHIKFKARRRARSRADQYIRLRLLSLAQKL